MRQKLDSPVAVTRSSLPPLEEYVDMLKPLWESAWLTNMGDYHEQFKEQLKEYLMIPELEGEVITTPFSFASTTHAIVRNGLTPVFCDINPVDYTLDAEQLESRITERTSAIVPVHVYGNLCDVERMEQIARKYHLKVIYDAAHAFGETLDGRGVAEFGDVSMFSFHATKVFHSIEEFWDHWL